jgi:hypothetical protein
MGRRSFYLHIGIPGSGGGFLDATLVEHAHALEEMGVLHPTVAADEAFRAAIEIRRDHKAWGHRRQDVDGTWAEICRRVRKAKSTTLLSQELFAGCSPAQVALLLDTLHGIDVQVVITARRADAERHELAELTARWTEAVGSPDRLHVLVVPVDAEPRDWIWRSLGQLVGFDAARLPVADGGLPPYLLRSLAQAAGCEPHDSTPVAAEDQLWWTTALLSAALVEVAQLREHERALAERNAKLEKKRSKLKRRIAELT